MPSTDRALKPFSSQLKALWHKALAVCCARYLFLCTSYTCLSCPTFFSFVTFVISPHSSPGQPDRSRHDLVLMHPLDSLSKNASICGGLMRIRHALVESICRFELPLIVRVAIANYNLRRVLVRHHHSWCGQLRPCCCWVVCHQRLFAHACMLDVVLLVSFPKFKTDK